MEEEKEEKEVLLLDKPKKHFPRWLLFGSAILLGLMVLAALSTFFILDHANEISNLLGIKNTQDTTSNSFVPTIVLTEEENNTVNVVKNAQDSVVSIAVASAQISSNGIVNTENNIGTGFVIDPGGLIVTNQHVVSDTTATYIVVTSDDKEYDVQSIARDDVYDIAILKIDAENLKALTLGDSDAVVVGQDVIAIGTPLGEYAGSVTKGIISGLHRTVTASSDWYDSTSKTYEDVIQTDAAVNPGNSGGPLLNGQGEVIGINFATTSNANNISFALPINRVKERISEYRTYGKFIKSYLGVSYQMISSDVARYYASSNIVAGAYVVTVDPSGPAALGGIKKGDIITKFGDDSVTDSLSLLIQKHKKGDKVSVEVYREGKYKTLEVTLTEADN